jgi:3-methyladenine DNA glycosylase/8-oxoguanine DNA glycosylase
VTSQGSIEQSAGSAAPLPRTFEITNGANPVETMAVLRQGPRDPQMSVALGTVTRAMRTANGPATVRISVEGKSLRVLAWGPGGAVAIDAVPGLAGLHDDAHALVPHHPVVADIARRRPGLRLTRTGSVMDALVVSILGQKVQGEEAHRAHRGLLMRYGERAPGPFRLWVPPTPQKLARLPYWAYHEIGLERRRADVIRAAAAVAPQLERIADMSHDDGDSTLRSLNGIGVWTAAETMRLALGDPDAVSVGDYHLPHLVCRTLAGEPRGTDERMLELLEPYRGQRARVALLLEHGVAWQERRAPRRRLRSIATY